MVQITIAVKDKEFYRDLWGQNLSILEIIRRVLERKMWRKIWIMGIIPSKNFKWGKLAEVIADED